VLRLLHHFFLGAVFFATGFFATGFFAAGFFAAAMWFSPPTGMGYISVNLGINKYFGRNAIFTHRIGINNHFCSVIMARSDNKHRICLIICKMRNLFQQPCSCHCLHGCDRSGPVQQQPGDPEHACSEALHSSDNGLVQVWEGRFGWCRGDKKRIEEFFLKSISHHL
jgi:hypothetical protein